MLFISCTLCSNTLRFGPFEYIEQFNANITVLPSGNIKVIETITYVNLSGQQKRGIFRNIPRKTDITVIDVSRNNRPEEHTVSTAGRYTQIRIGSPNRFIKGNRHTYQIAYTAPQQILFFKDHDELYWNVTGTKWPWQIKKVTARVTLPANIPADNVITNIMTGAWGSKEQNARVKQKDGSFLFETTTPLQAEEGLTIALLFPKGFITEPSRVSRWLQFLKYHGGTLLFLLLIFFYLIYTFKMFRRIRREERAVPIIPLFYPPNNINPAGARYVMKRHDDTQGFAAELVNMAVKGVITIECQSGWLKKKTYILHRITPEQEQRDPLHEQLLAALFPSGKNELELSKTNRTIIEKAQKQLKKILGKNYASDFHQYYPLTQRGYIISGLLFAFSVIWSKSMLVLWTIIKILGASGIFFLGYALLSRYSKSGQTLVAQIKGFALFLKTTETERLELIGTPPTRTPELFERYLPYAIALNAERQWTAQFASVFKDLEQAGKPYQATWFVGQTLDAHALSSFASDLKKEIASALQSAMPQSSGGPGKGFSGGGRGGGGGGSW